MGQLTAPSGFNTDGVHEGAMRHLHQGLAHGLNPIDVHRLGELELELGLGHGEEQEEAGLALEEPVRLRLNIFSLSLRMIIVLVEQLIRDRSQ